MKEVMQEIISRAVYAPSGDNSQPWRFEIFGDKLRIFNIPTRDNPVLNFKQSGSYIAHGGLLENISIIAPAFGYEPRINLFPQAPEPDLVAEITFVTIEPRPDPLINIIPKRCSNRRSYDKNRFISKEIVTEIAGLRNNHAKVSILEDRDKIKQTSQSLSQMEQIALENHSIHRLFFGDILWSNADNQTGKPGLFIKSLELPAPMQYLFRLLQYWPVTRVANILGFSNLARIGNSGLYSQSAAHVGILIENDDPTSFINAGRLTQRVWLTATKYGISVQPVTGILFLGRKFLAGDRDGFSNKHINKAVDAYSKIKKIFGIDEKQEIAMLLRVGYAKEPTARSFRLTPQISMK